MRTAIRHALKTRWIKLSFLLLATVVTFVALAPTLISTRYGQRIVLQQIGLAPSSQVSPHTINQVRCTGFSIGWFTPLELHNVSLTSRQFRAMSRRVHTNATLTQLLNSKHTIRAYTENLTAVVQLTTSQQSDFTHASSIAPNNSAKKKDLIIPRKIFFTAHNARLNIDNGPGSSTTTVIDDINLSIDLTQSSSAVARIESSSSTLGRSSRVQGRFDMPLSDVHSPRGKLRFQNVDLVTAHSTLNKLGIHDPFELIPWSHAEDGSCQPRCCFHQYCLLPENTCGASGTIVFTNAGPVLKLDEGIVINQIPIESQISALMSRCLDQTIVEPWSLEGTLSLEIDSLHMPLSANGTSRSTAHGRILLDDVSFKPGPALVNILKRAGIEPPDIISTNEAIDVWVEGGKLYYSGLSLPIEEELVQLHGWLSRNQSVRLVMNLPVTKRMVGGSRSLYWMVRDRRIEVPLSGSLRRIYVHEKELKWNINDMIKQSVQARLSEIGKSLRKR